jgi:hypothetical protein
MSCGCFVMRDLEAMREISCSEIGQGWACWSFAPIALSRPIEGGVSDRTANGRGETQESFDYAAHDETALCSVEMTWLWE